METSDYARRQYELAYRLLRNRDRSDCQEEWNFWSEQVTEYCEDEYADKAFSSLRGRYAYQIVHPKDFWMSVYLKSGSPRAFKKSCYHADVWQSSYIPF